METMDLHVNTQVGSSLMDCRQVDTKQQESTCTKGIKQGKNKCTTTKDQAQKQRCRQGSKQQREREVTQSQTAPDSSIGS